LRAGSGSELGIGEVASRGPAEYSRRVGLLGVCGGGDAKGPARGTIDDCAVADGESSRHGAAARAAVGERAAWYRCGVDSPPGTGERAR